MSLHYAENRCHITKCRHEGQAALKIEGPCIVTGKPQTVILFKSELEAYNKGAMIQVAFARLSSDDREFLMSGHSKEGWDITFAGCEDDYEEPDLPKSSFPDFSDN